MLSQTAIFGLLAGLLLLGFTANKMFRRTGVPDLIVLLLVGLLLGPLLRLVDGTQFQTFTNLLGTFAMILILFESGTELNFAESLKLFPSAIVLTFAGYLLTFSAVSAAAFLTLHLPLKYAFVVGGVLGCSSSTMIVAALQQIQPPTTVKVIMVIDSALGDTLTVLVVGSLVDIADGDPFVSAFVGGFIVRMLISLAIALIAAYLWSRVSPRISEPRFKSIAVLGVVLAVYSLSRTLGGSGLLGVLILGLALGNISYRAMRIEPQELVFHSELSFLVRSFFFVLLGIEVELVSWAHIIPVLAILAGLLISRIVAVRSLALVQRLSSKDLELIFWMFPRGLVTAVLALKVVQKMPQFSYLPALALTVIVLTNIFLSLVHGGFAQNTSYGCSPTMLHRQIRDCFKRRNSSQRICAIYRKNREQSRDRRNSR